MKTNQSKKWLQSIALLTAFSTIIAPLSVVESFAWNSSEDISKHTTHPLLVEQGLTILMNDLSESDRNNPEFMAVLTQIQLNMDQLKRGAVSPDFGDSNYTLYQDHFYDPFTEQNFTSLSNSMSTGILDFVYYTAMHRSKEYTGWALQQWKLGNYSNATYNFGKAMHFYSDICEPHHASNAIGGTHEPMTKHSGFEVYADTVFDQNRMNSLGGNTSSEVYALALSGTYYSDFIQSEGRANGKIAQNLYTGTFQSGNQATWYSTAEQSLKLNQKAVALAIFRFAKEVTNPASESMHASSGSVQLSVRVKTTSGSLSSCYGTDNDVFFGVELKNGRIQEWPLDLSSYNDHENGDNDTYQVTLNQASGADVRKAWIRKQRGWQASTAEDNWHLAEVEVNSNDNMLNFIKPVNNWIKGNTGVDLFGL